MILSITDGGFLSGFSMRETGLDVLNISFLKFADDTTDKKNLLMTPLF